jgi:hypothetical protein
VASESSRHCPFANHFVNQLYIGESESTTRAESGKRISLKIVVD